MLVSHRDNSNFTRAQWKKRIILPCWAVQVIVICALIGIFSYRLSHTLATWEEEDSKGTVPVVELVWEASNIGFSLISLVITLVAVARFIAEVLTPVPLLFGCILNVVLSIVVLALDVVVYTQRSDSNYSLIGLGLDAVLIVFSVIPLFYAIRIYRHLLTYDDYHLPYNHKGYGFAGAEEGVDEASSMYTMDQMPPTPYDPTDVSFGNTTTITAAPLESRSRANSLSQVGRRISQTFNLSTSPQPSPPIPPPAVDQRRTSYDHKRDTQFEDYLARRQSTHSSGHVRNSFDSSNVSLHEDVRRAMGTEFGWPDTSSHPGSMKSQHAPMGRHASVEAFVSSPHQNGSPSLTVTVTTPPEEGSQQHGHSLIMVPESHEEEDHNEALAKSGKPPVGDSRGSSGSGSGRISPTNRIEQVAGLQDIALGDRKRRRDS
ncbi:hypothetical protein GGR57DRAFT_499590 [Xylariaceae sp. FL1272]|nr:hypothetical protein GGR57DRAFT_499590 [Xylariaceae sp. FL1272]